MQSNEESQTVKIDERLSASVSTAKQWFAQHRNDSHSNGMICTVKEWIFTNGAKEWGRK